MTAAPDILYRQAAALLEQSHTAQALPLLQQAAEQGYTEAAFALGNHLLQNGQPKQALSWLEAAAAQRHPEALFTLLQQREQNGTPTGQLLNDYAWLGEQGHLEAQLILMRYHAQRNDPQSLYWAELAAARYAAPAYYHLARHHQRQGDVETAIEQYEKAAALGVTAACWQLGQIYFYGAGVSHNYAQAEQYLEQAAQAGHIAAQTLLADLLAAQRKPEALEWYRRAADKEQAEAQAKLAQYALTGELSERDPFQAARYAKAAAEKNHPEALKIMGDLYRYGLGIKADNHVAHDYYHRAAALGSAAAAQKLISDAALYHPQQYEQIKTAALQQQQTETIYHLAEAQAHAIGRPADYNAARKNYMEAAEFHHKNAAAALGRIYHYGLGTAQDPRAAAHWYAIAAEQNHPSAQYHLACFYYHGQGVGCHVPTACYWLQAAISNGHTSAESLTSLLEQWRHEVHHTIGQKAV